MQEHTMKNQRFQNSRQTMFVKYLVTVIQGIFLLSLMCGYGEAQSSTKHRVVYVAMSLGRGGLGDRSFNDAAYKGLQEAQTQYGIRFEAVPFVSEDRTIEELSDFAFQGYDLIIGIGFENAPVIETIARDFPELQFVIIDTAAKGENVASIVFREQEGDFLMGVLAAMLTKSRKVGFISGVDFEVIRRIESGFKQGVAYQDDRVEVVSDLAGTFTEPGIGKSLALAQYETGVDIIYNAAGRTGLGIIEAAKETGKFVIGTSGEQRYLAPGNVVGNRPKRVDIAVLMVIEEILNGTFSPGIRSLGLKEEGLSIGPFDANIVTDAMQERVEALKQQIIAGKIQITTPEE